MDTKQKPKTNNSNQPERKNNFRSNNKRGGSFERVKPEFDQKIVSIRRVTRVVSGGRRMSFAVAMAIGDKKGSIGLGTGKGTDTALAIAKALRQAKKNMFKIKTTKENSIPNDVSVKYASTILNIMPNNGKGLVAGSTVRDVLILGGIKNVTAKIHSRSKNKLNNARAITLALSKFAVKGGREIKKEIIKEDIEEKE